MGVCLFNDMHWYNMLYSSINHYKNSKNYFKVISIGLHHPLDDITYPKKNLLLLLNTRFFQRYEGISFQLGLMLPSSTLFKADPLPLLQSCHIHETLICPKHLAIRKPNIN